MSEKLKQFLETKALLRTEKTGTPVARDLQISTIVLLMKIANVDGNTHANEIGTIVRTVVGHFELEDETAAELIEIADFLRRDKQDIDGFIDLINQRFEDSQKVTICALLWKIMIADGVVSSAEAVLATDIAEKLGISSEQLKQAKQLVEDGEV